MKQSVCYWNSYPYYKLTIQIVERYKFLTRQHREGESCRFCWSFSPSSPASEYDTQRDAILRDQIVIGVADVKTREKLLRLTRLMSPATSQRLQHRLVGTVFYAYLLEFSRHRKSTNNQWSSFSVIWRESKSFLTVFRVGSD